MTFADADKIFKHWSKWHWPCHFMLHSIFLGKIPESFLPFPQDTLEEALNIVAKRYHDSGDLETSEAIQNGIASLAAYTKDEDALGQAAKTFSNPEMREVILTYIANYKRDWQSWLKKQS